LRRKAATLRFVMTPTGFAISLDVECHTCKF
jgi:hypothetical protein